MHKWGVALGKRNAASQKWDVALQKRDVASQKWGAALQKRDVAFGKWLNINEFCSGLAPFPLQRSGGTGFVDGDYR